MVVIFVNSNTTWYVMFSSSIRTVVVVAAVVVAATAHYSSAVHLDSTKAMKWLMMTVLASHLDLSPLSWPKVVALDVLYIVNCLRPLRL